MWKDYFHSFQPLEENTEMMAQGSFSLLYFNNGLLKGKHFHLPAVFEIFLASISVFMSDAISHC